MMLSATKRESKRQQTALRICRCAQRLTAERGLDGFTMEDLAEAADVARRTLFNYFPGKVDAVLGPVPELPDAARATFRAGGPHGSLIDDVAVLAHHVLASDDLGLDRDDVRRSRHLITTTPRLLVAVHERFEEVTGDIADLIAEREGDRLDPLRARLLIRLLVTVFDATITAFVGGDERPLPDLFDDILRTARDLLA